MQLRPGDPVALPSGRGEGARLPRQRRGSRATRLRGRRDDPTQQLTFRAGSPADLGTVLEQIGKPDDACFALTQALDLYERKATSCWPKEREHG